MSIMTICSVQILRISAIRSGLREQIRRGKIRLLLDYTDRPGCSIADPWYSGNFEDTYRDVDAGCEGFLAYLKEKGAI